MPESVQSTEDYYSTLGEYLRTHGEEPLYRAGLLSQNFIESGFGPEDIIALHCEALERYMAELSSRQQVQASVDAHQFLLEMMIAYGIKYREYLELKLTSTVNDAESRALRDRERALEAERLQREKDDILAAIAHELRTPITVARGNLDLASRSLKQGEVTSIPTYLGSAREAVERLSRLSADLVEASRGNDPQLKSEPLEIAPIIDQASAWARAAALSKGLDLIVEHSDQQIRVPGDADALLSVFGNLLSNAIRYTPAGGKVIIRERLEGDLACVEVEDNGIGMTPEVQSRAFEKFYRGDEAHNVDGQGLGLGLPLVRQMIDHHKGTVEIESTPNLGSTFRVLLPCLREEE